MIRMSLHEFTAKRRKDQDALEARLHPIVQEAVDRFVLHRETGTEPEWYADLLVAIARAYREVFDQEGGEGEVDPAKFLRDVSATLDKTKGITDITDDRIAVWLATAILNAATMAAADTDPEFLVMEWVTMHDDLVRDTHRETDGQQRPVGEPFDVSGVAMRYPGDPTVDPSLWMNCRCALAPVLPEQASFQTTSTSSMEEPMSQTATESVMLEVPTITWHGILAPEGEWSGDGRMFAPDSLRFRDLPLPLTWQKVSDDGHKGSVTVATIDSIERVDGMMQAAGRFLQTPEADEVIGLLSEFGKFGVSVDADDAEFEFDEEDRIAFTSARISSASIVAIPAFAQAFVALGDWGTEAAPSGDDEEPSVQGPEPIEADEPEVAAAEFISDKPWDGSAGRFTPEQWKKSCVMHVCSGMEKSCHKLPILEPGGQLSRAGVHAAAGRINQTDGPAEAKASAKRALRGAYAKLGEDIPDVLKAAVVELGRGPGWVTNPKETKRLHDYWTKPGHEGYAKIGWGTPGDFNRCRAQVGEEIGENSPDKVRFLNQICAQWHHDALGFWPGHAPTEQSATLPEGPPAEALSLSASGGWCAPSEWFRDPRLSEGTHLTVTEEGRVFGHLAQWETCHIGYEGVCVAPPNSATAYAYFLTGQIQTNDGMVPCGALTLGGGHADGNLSYRGTVAHYDSTSSVVAYVTCGEDEHGIWLAGAIPPWVPEDQITQLRAADVSGDWRDIGGNLELVAALAVNVGGFPTPRTRVTVHAGVQTALVAAGMVQTKKEQVIDVAAIAAAVVKEMAESAQRKMKVAALAAKVHGKDED